MNSASLHSINDFFDGYAQAWVLNNAPVTGRRVVDGVLDV